MNSSTLSNYECIGYDTRHHVKPVLSIRGRTYAGMSKNKLLQNIFLSEKGENKRRMRKLHNEEHHDLLFSTNVMRVNKSRRMRVAKLVVSITRVKTGWWKNLKESLGRLKGRLECNVQADPSEMAFVVMEYSCCWR